MTAKIKVENLTKVFNGNYKTVLKRLQKGESKEQILKETGITVGLNNVSFEVQEGEIFVIMGLSGSGKSTLLRCLNLLNVPSAGSIFVDGSNIVKYTKKELKEFRQTKVGMVFQHFGLFTHRTVLKNVEYGLEIRGVPKEERTEIAKKTLAAVGLEGWEEHFPSQLSGGMCQRVGLARALANDPDILLMDEPFSALDVTTQATLTSLIKSIGKKYKTTFVHVTHNFNDVWNLADRVGVMKNGILHQLDYIDTVFSKPNNKFVADFVGVNNIIKGKVDMYNDGLMEIKINDNLTLYSADKEYYDKNKNIENQEVLVAIRPENIIFSNDKIKSSAKNQLKGIIKNIEIAGHIINVVTEVENVKFKGILTKNSYELLNIKKGNEIYLIFKSMNINIIESYNKFNLNKN